LNFFTFTFIALGRNHIASTPITAIAMLCFNYTVGLPWSVPVLSRLLNVNRRESLHKGTAASYCTPLPGCKPAPDKPVSRYPEGLQPIGSHQLQPLPKQLPTTARLTQSSEPILFPKLRIQFADFPYLHCSKNQRLCTLETCCGYRYGLPGSSLCLARIFKGRRQRTGHRKNRSALRTLRPYLRPSRFQGTRALTKKR
jgi:hypothetical protein